jgi:hypothetical protein
MRRYQTHSDSKSKATFENLIAFRSKSKEAIDKMKVVYGRKNGEQPGGIVGVRIRDRNHHTPSPQKSVGELKIKIPIKSRTPNSKSPACLSRREEPRKVEQIALTARPIPRLEELRRRPTDKATFKLGNTQKFFRKERERPRQPEANNLTETLKMVW